jgi:arsenite methyltransferase
MANVLMRMFDVSSVTREVLEAGSVARSWCSRMPNRSAGRCETPICGRAMTVLVVGHGPGLGLVLASAAVGPGGHVIGVDPSKTMRQMATRRCATQIDAGMIELRDGTAEDSGCGPGTVDAVFSVNNAMLWDRVAGFSEFHRVLGPGGRLVLTVHRHVLDFAAEELRRDAAAAGLTEMSFNQRKRRFYSPAVELIARCDIAA